MAGKIVDDRDLQFVMWEHLELEKHLEDPIFKGYGKEDLNMIIEEARKFAETAIYPINMEGDRQGVHIVDGVVKAPECYRAPYDELCEGGWIGLGTSEKLGGQGLPAIAGLPVTEYWGAASTAFTMFPGLNRAALHLMENCCSDELNAKYTPKMIEGKWQGTMCLTEPSAGSAVGDCKSTAKKRDDGTWEINGSKIFISCGDHDICENHIHLVLARAEGSPAGIKGISLFVVPKYLVKEDGNIGDYNNVKCPKVEEKMGIHGSPTCELVFGDEGTCVGELVGELNKGIKYMFFMMNEARVGTGLQAHTSASAAYLHALAYARDRVQGVAIENMRDVNAPRVEIINHPDVRRMLLFQKSITEGMRALIYRGAWYGTLAEMGDDEAKKEKYEDWFSMLTPVIKSWCSDMAYRSLRDSVQTYGGYGYTSEYPVEQYMRDCKIMSIYEGTNAIQSLDLIARKVLNIKKEMKPFKTYLADMKQFVEDNKGNERCGAFIEKIGAAVTELEGVTNFIAGKGMTGDMVYPVMYATPYMDVFGHVIVGHLLAEHMIIADAKLEAIYKDKGATDDEAKAKVIEDLDDAAFYQGKIYSASFYIDFVLPEINATITTIKSENRDMINIPDKCFG